MTQNMNKILIIEDEKDILENLSEFFEISGYQVYKAANGKAGVSLARSIYPDLVISDVLMPELGGMEVVQLLKNDARLMEVPIILLTAKNMIEAKIEGLGNGADDYVTKPFHFDELLARVKTLINNRKRVVMKMNLLPDHKPMESKETIFIKKINGLLDQHLDQAEYGLEQLSSDLGYSRSSVQKKLKALTHKSANKYLRDYRLERARQMVEQNAANLGEIAASVGFNSLSYFSSSYKEYFGVSPKQSQKKNVPL